MTLSNFFLTFKIIINFFYLIFFQIKKRCYKNNKNMKKTVLINNYIMNKNIIYLVEH